MSDSGALASQPAPQLRAASAAIAGSRSGKLTQRPPARTGSRASQSGSACAHSVLLPAPRQTTMSPGGQAPQHRDDIALAVDAGDGGVAGGADGLGQRSMVDAVDRRLAGRIERRDDHLVGILEAGGELAEQVAHARVAMRLDQGDDAAARAGAGGLQHGGDLDGMVAVVVVDGHAVPGAGELEAALDAGEAGNGLADHVVGDAGLAGCRDGGQRVERIVVPAAAGCSSRAMRARATVHARAEVGVEDGRSCLRRAPT